MAIDFKVKDILHQIAVKFTHAFLPEAKKPYYAKAKLQPVLGLHEIASKADVYNIQTPSKTIEEGMNAGMQLMFYLAADGYILQTPMFNLRMRIPGEYDGTETHLAEGIHPQARLQTSAEFREYIQNNVTVVFDGVDDNDGHIGEARDEATGLFDDIMTRGNILTIHGTGLKIESDDAHKGEVGLFFTAPNGAQFKADIIAVNEPKTIKAVVPSSLPSAVPFTICIKTQSSAKGSNHLLKELRELKSEFTLTVQ
jgi:hypothetical protein